MRLIVPVLLVALFRIFNSFAGGAVTAADCINAVNICQNASFAIDPNGSGSVMELLNNNFSNPTINPGSLNSGCLLSGELNPTWMVINIAGSGTLEFSFGQDASPGCLDWAMWPYSSNGCTQIINNQLKLDTMSKISEDYFNHTNSNFIDFIIRLQTSVPGLQREHCFCKTINIVCVLQAILRSQSPIAA